MAKSRMAAGMVAGAAAILVAAPAYAVGQAPAPALTAEEAIARQEVAVERSLGIGCHRKEGEILVCAPLNRGGIAFPEEEGKRKRLIAGEGNAPGPISNLGSCCGARGGLNVIKIGETAGKILGKIF